MLVKMWRKEMLNTVWGNKNWCTTIENSMEVLQKIKENHHVILYIYPKEIKSFCVFIQRKENLYLVEKPALP